MYSLSSRIVVGSPKVTYTRKQSTFKNTRQTVGLFFCLSVADNQSYFRIMGWPIRFQGWPPRPPLVTHKSLGLIFWTPWMSVQNFVPIHQIDFEIFHRESENSDLMVAMEEKWISKVINSSNHQPTLASTTFYVNTSWQVRKSNLAMISSWLPFWSCDLSTQVRWAVTAPVPAGPDLYHRTTPPAAWMTTSLRWELSGGTRIKTSDWGVRNPRARDEDKHLITQNQPTFGVENKIYSNINVPQMKTFVQGTKWIKGRPSGNNWNYLVSQRENLA